VEADLKNKQLEFTVDTTYQRRLKPSAFFEKNNKPLLVVNTTFFSFATNQNLNLVIKDGKLVGYNIQTINGRGKDTFTYRHTFPSALGITKARRADIAWTFTDSSMRYAYASQTVIEPLKDSSMFFPFHAIHKKSISPTIYTYRPVKKWKVQTAIGGGPVLLQNGEIRISNDAELKFAGKAIEDKHPRTAIGYTGDDKLIIMVIQGRFPGIAEGATLKQEAQVFKDLGCREALNLDGGGSSCMLVNGKETIKVSDAAGQRPVPAVFLIKQR
jgi:exopolysaccharide biosynthesis protein